MNLDPLLLITGAVLLMLLAVVGRWLLTGQFEEKLFVLLLPILGSLIAAYSTKRKDSKEDKNEP